MTSIVHIAGSDIQVNDRLRQRCGWCGTILLDYDLTRIAVPEGQDPRPGTFPPGELVEVDGGAYWVRPQPREQPLPKNACALIDPDITGTGSDTNIGGRS